MNVRLHHKYNATKLQVHRFLCISLALITLLSPLSAFASTTPRQVKYNNVIYIMNSDGTWGVSHTTGYDVVDTLSIPTYIDGSPVASIIYRGAGQRVHCKNLVIPGSISNIINNAFMECRIEYLYISEGVTSIGNSAFYWNPLREVTLPSTLTSIGLNAFDYLNGQPIKGLVFNVVKGSYAEFFVKQNYPYAKIRYTSFK